MNAVEWIDVEPKVESRVDDGFDVDLPIHVHVLVDGPEAGRVIERQFGGATIMVRRLPRRFVRKYGPNDPIPANAALGNEGPRDQYAADEYTYHSLIAPNIIICKYREEP